MIPDSSKPDGWIPKRAIDLRENDELFIIQRNRDTVELEVTVKPIVFLEKKIIRARKLWEFSLSNHHAFCAKGIVVFDGQE